MWLSEFLLADRNIHLRLSWYHMGVCILSGRDLEKGARRTFEVRILGSSTL